MNPPGPGRSLWLRFLRLFAVASVLALVGVGLRTWYAFRDRNPGYTLQLGIEDRASRAAPRPLRVGFAREKINPALAEGSPPVWLAGFSQNRRATAVHDDLWAVAGVIDDGYTRVGFVSLDAIGFMHDDAIAVRRRLEAGLKLDYAIVCATHNHSTPDLLGLWGPHPLKNGVDPAYREQVIATAARTLASAVRALEPAAVSFYEINVPPDGLVTDTRKPIVFDADLRVMHFTLPGTTATIGTLVSWGNHPETPWSRNTEITADFCGFLRDALEKGVTDGDGRPRLPGLGGVHCFINGAVGGLMTTSPSVTVPDPFASKRSFKAPGHDKSRALGQQLAARILPRLQAAGVAGTTHAPLAVQARTIELPVDNPNFLLAPILGILDRGHARFRHLRTEVAVLRFGEASIACVPGEIYPEIVNGGIERPPGADFDLPPVEVPPLREFLPGRVKFVLGLANDEIGYIIPRSEWDQKPPYLYGAAKPVYGEVNSLGPETAPRLHAALRELSRALESAGR
ncbi:MAG: hypothetical protein HZC55_07540 [Verrucomicrobia bacterium]|nr:hypothetical protein [Verrucomicrobiota bacterium]